MPKTRRERWYQPRKGRYQYILATRSTAKGKKGQLITWQSWTPKKFNTVYVQIAWKNKKTTNKANVKITFKKPLTQTQLRAEATKKIKNTIGEPLPPSAIEQASPGLILLKINTKKPTKMKYNYEIKNKQLMRVKKW